MGMASLSDIKTQQLTASGSITTDRCRIKAFTYKISTAAEGIEFRRGGSGGTVVASFELDVGTDTIYFQEDGLLLSDSPYVTFGGANLTHVTVQYA
jgi:hypothetical protein